METKKKNMNAILLLKQALLSPKYGAFILLLVMCAVFGCVTDTFLTSRNLITLMRQSSFYIMVGMGLMCVFMSASFDMSVGSTMSLAAVFGALLCRDAGLPFWLVFILCIVLGAVCGAINGFMVGYLGFPPFIATIGTQIMYGGLAIIITGGVPVTNMPEGFNYLGTTSWFGIPAPIIIMLIVCLLTYILLNKTLLGRRMVATGGNPQAAVISGIDIRKVRLQSYIICHIFCAVAGIVLCSRFGSGQIGVGSSYNIYAIAGVVIGGTAMTGGSGTVFGVFCGIMVITVLKNGLDMLGVNAYWQEFCQGAMIVLAMLFDIVRRSFNKQK